MEPFFGGSREKPWYMHRLAFRACLPCTLLQRARRLNRSTQRTTHGSSTDASFPAAWLFERELEACSAVHVVGDTSEVAGPFRYWSAWSRDGLHACMLRVPAASPDRRNPQVVLDMSDVSREQGVTVPLGAMSVSPDPLRRLVMYLTDPHLNDRMELRVRDIASGREQSCNTIGGVANALWLPFVAARPMAFLYTELDATNRAWRVRRHVLGAPAATDLVVYEEARADRHVSLAASKDGALVTLCVNNRDDSDVLIYFDGDSREKQRPPYLVRIVPPPDIDAAPADAAPAGQSPVAVLLQPPPPPQFFAAHHAGALYIVTNLGGAGDYQVATCRLSSYACAVAPPPPDARATSPAGCCAVASVCVPWRPFVPHRPGTAILEMEVCGDSVVLFERRSAAPQITVVPLPPPPPQEGADCRGHTAARAAAAEAFCSAYRVPLPEGACEVLPGANADAGSPLLRFSAAFATRPGAEYSWDLRARTLRQVARCKLGPPPSPPPKEAASWEEGEEEAGGSGGPRLISYTVHAPSWDGAAVPLTLVHRADLGIPIDALKAASAALCHRAAAAAAATAAKTAGQPPPPRVNPVACALASAVRGWDDWRVEGGVPVPVPALKHGAVAAAAAAAGGGSPSCSTDQRAYPLLAPHLPFPLALAQEPLPHAAASEPGTPFERLCWYLGMPAPSPPPPTPTLEATTWRQRPTARLSSFIQRMGITASAAAAVPGGGDVGTHRRQLGGLDALRFPSLHPELLQVRCGGGAADTTAAASAIAPAAAAEAGAHQTPLLLAPPPPFARPPPHAWAHANPLLLHVYGAYGESLSAAFDPLRLPLLRRGWVLAFAHVRGGGEGSELPPPPPPPLPGTGDGAQQQQPQTVLTSSHEWYTAGRGAQRHNSLHDALAAARACVALGLSRSRWMALRAESAGGVPAGYLAAAFPHLFHALLLRAPFVDVAGAMADADAPLTAVERVEWGDPARAGDREYIAAYSPLGLPARLREAAASSFSSSAAAAAAAAAAVVPPHMLVVAAAADRRVPPHHATRLVAQARNEWCRSRALLAAAAAARGGGGGSSSSSSSSAQLSRPPVLVCRVRAGEGHEGPADPAARRKAAADEAAFLYAAMGLGATAL